MWHFDQYVKNILSQIAGVSLTQADPQTNLATLSNQLETRRYEPMRLMSAAKTIAGSCPPLKVLEVDICQGDRSHLAGAKRNEFPRARE